jgi:hexosaminidase
MISNIKFYSFSIFLGLLATIVPTVIFAQNIIPRPGVVEKQEGSFTIKQSSSINADPAFSNEAKYLAQKIFTYVGVNLPVTHLQNENGQDIILKKSAANKGKEAYQLTVNPSSIVIEASDPAGAFYGCVSLLQLLSVDNYGRSGAEISAVRIIDSPRFKWRGLMLDVSRTFMSVDYVKNTIDRMAFYKLNVLHLHLTDDQGWRSPIKSYPLLNTKGARFDSSYNEPAQFQGCYSAADIKELVSYAAARHIDVVPEIESPGHSHAALFAYPEFSCSGKISPVYPYFAGPGITSDVFCAGNPGSIRFFQTIINETAAMFPSNYFHVGGDEVPRTSWQSCPKCQQLVKTAKLEGTQEIQGYFMQQLHDHVAGINKRPVAWDEILHDNKFLTKDWIIMSWTGSKPGWDAAAKGYDVVMTPTSHMYFDYPYKVTNTNKVFEYEPLEGCGDSSSVSKHILGIQANFWSHIDRTESKIDYQLFPRALALAERAWSDINDRDYEDFKRRLVNHRKWLNTMHVKYFAGDF